MTWLRRIELAKMNGHFTFTDRVLAQNWPTCACGEQDGKIQRDADGGPLDGELFDLGISFYNAVKRNLPDEALRVLQGIETRVAFLYTHPELMLQEEPKA